MRYLAAAALLSVFNLVVRADEPKKPDHPKPVKIPFVLVSSGHFIVDVKVDGKGPYKLIFDTGAPTMLISTRVAQDAGLVAKKKGGGGGLLGLLSDVAPVTIKSLEIGPLKAEMVNAMAFDHPTVKAFSKFYEKEHGSIEGIVGFPFFARYRMTVDYQARTLTLTPNGYEPADIMQTMLNFLMSPEAKQNKPKIAAAAGQWGIVVGKDDKDDKPGVNIREVLRDSAAAKAGLKPGDRLLTIDGRWTDSVADTYQAAGFVRPGKPVVVVVERDGKETKLTVTPANGL